MLEQSHGEGGMVAHTHSIPGSVEDLTQNNACPMMETQLQIPVVLPGPFPELQSEAEKSSTPPLPALLPHDPLLMLLS